MQIYISILITIIGLVVGSFLNVVILRLHAKKDFVKGRSECPHCGHKLAWYDNIPLLSFALLGGRCRYCRGAISWQYPAVELLTAAVFLLTYLTHPFDGVITAADVLVLIMWLYIAASLVVLAVYDLKWYLLPDKVLLPIIVPAGAILLGTAIQAQSLRVADGPVLAALIFGGFFYLIAAVSNGRWMGGGDIKLAFVMGLLLGLQKTALAMLIAFNAAAIVGVALMVSRRLKRTDHIPFGPFLIGGTLVAYWYGEQIIDWYLKISGLGSLFL